MQEKQVFISYKAEEINEAKWVRDRLEKEGISCWMAPDSIPGGSSYAVQIPKAIRECTAFVLILSKNAQESKWVPREIDQAINAGKVILPFSIENCPLQDDFGFYLSNVQRYDAWQNREYAFSSMVRVIRALLNEKNSDAIEEDRKNAEEEAKKARAEAERMKAEAERLRAEAEAEKARLAAEVEKARAEAEQAKKSWQEEVLLRSDDSTPADSDSDWLKPSLPAVPVQPEPISDAAKVKKVGKKKGGLKKIAIGAAILILGIAAFLVIRNMTNKIVIAGQEFKKTDTSVYLSQKTITSEDVAKFKKFKRLLNICLSDCDIEAAYLNGMMQPTLTGFKIPGCEITEAQAATLRFSDAPLISTLDISGNPGFTTLDLSPSFSEKLSNLNISSTSITDLTPLKAMKNLSVLTAEYCGLTDISVLSGLEKLVRLDLSNNELESLEALQDCVKLEMLDVACNKLSSLEGIEQCIKMKELYADRNEILDLEPMSNMTILERVGLSDNEISDIEILGKSKATLTFLSLEDNNISDLKALAGTSALKALYIRGNMLETLKDLNASPALEVLDASDNEITEMTAVIGMQKLTELDLSGNLLDGTYNYQAAEWPRDKRLKVDFSNNGMLAVILPKEVQFQMLDLHGNSLDKSTFQGLYKTKINTLVLDYSDDFDPQTLKKAGNITNVTLIDVPLDRQVAMEQVLGVWLTMKTTEEYELAE